MESPIDVAARKSRKIQIKKPQVNNHEEEALWNEVCRFQKMVPHAPDPNLGRVQEIKDEIRKGHYLTREMIDEAATQIALRFQKPESGA